MLLKMLIRLNRRKESTFMLTPYFSPCSLHMFVEMCVEYSGLQDIRFVDW
jgi:hypothetical protein